MKAIAPKKENVKKNESLRSAALEALFFFVAAPVFPLRLIKKIHDKRRLKGYNFAGFVEMGGTRQFISLRGESKDNPVVFFLHGGPALPIRGMSRSFRSKAEKFFTVAEWDQRGSGRSDGGGDVTAEKLLSDLDEAVDYIRAFTGKRKIILAGHCWGSVLGVRYSGLHPEKIERYIGICQFVCGKTSYAAIRERALNVAKAKNRLDDADKIEKYYRALLASDGVANMDVDAWRGLHDLYEKYCGYPGRKSDLRLLASALCSPDFSARDFSYVLSWANLKKSMPYHRALMDECIFNTDFNVGKTELKMPVAFIEAAGDAVTDTGAALGFIRKISAPEKSVFGIRAAGHNVMFDNPDAFNRALLKASGYSVDKRLN